MPLGRLHPAPQTPLIPRTDHQSCGTQGHACVESHLRIYFSSSLPYATLDKPALGCRKAARSCVYSVLRTYRQVPPSRGLFGGQPGIHIEDADTPLFNSPPAPPFLPVPTILEAPLAREVWFIDTPRASTLLCSALLYSVLRTLFELVRISPALDSDTRLALFQNFRKTMSTTR